MSEETGDYRGHLCLPKGVWREYPWVLCSCCSHEYRDLYSDPGWMDFERAWHEIRSMGADYPLGELGSPLRMVPSVMEVIQHQAKELGLLREQLRNLIELNRPKEPYGTRDVEPWQG